MIDYNDEKDARYAALKSTLHRQEHINRDLKKEILKLQSLCRRASEEIRYLDDIIIKLHDKLPEARELLGWEDDDLWAGEASINLLNRLDGRTSGGYVENYDDLHLKMKELDGWYQAEHPDFYKPSRSTERTNTYKIGSSMEAGAEYIPPEERVYPSDNEVSEQVSEHNKKLLMECAELTKLYSEGKYVEFLTGTTDLTPEQLAAVAPLLKPAMQKLRERDSDKGEKK